MDWNRYKVKRTSPLGKNLPYGWTFLSLPRHFRWWRHDRHGRRLGLQLRNLILARNHCWRWQPKTLRQKIPFFCQNRKLVLYHRRLPWKIQVPKWHLLDGCDLVATKSNNHSQMEITKSQGQHIPYKMGPFFRSLRRENLHFRRQVQQRFERYSCSWFRKRNHEGHEDKRRSPKSQKKTQRLLYRQQHARLWWF